MSEISNAEHEKLEWEDNILHLNEFLVDSYKALATNPALVNADGRKEQENIAKWEKELEQLNYVSSSEKLQKIVETIKKRLECLEEMISGFEPLEIITNPVNTEIETLKWILCLIGE